MACSIGIGLYAAVTPWLLIGSQGLYAGQPAPGYHRRFVAHAALFARRRCRGPTFMMGGTLPLLCVA